MLTGKAADDYRLWAESQAYDRDISNGVYLDPICLQALQAEWLNSFRYEGVPLFDNLFSVHWKYKTSDFNYQQITKIALIRANDVYNILDETNR